MYLKHCLYSSIRLTANSKRQRWQIINAAISSLAIMFAVRGLNRKIEEPMPSGYAYYFRFKILKRFFFKCSTACKSYVLIIVSYISFSATPGKFHLSMLRTVSPSQWRSV